MRRRVCLAARNVVILAGMTLLLALPATSHADIYRWEDEAGVVHFTDDPSGIPEKYRRKAQDILKSPPVAGKPSLSTVGSSPPPAGGRPPAMEPAPSGDSAPFESLSPSVESAAAEAEQLRAKIAAKEQFIDTIDRKRSNTLNPFGNRFVDPVDLDLYKKYQEELPGDRSRLKDLESGLSPSVK